MLYDGFDESQIYVLRCRAIRTKQEGRSINMYFTELKSVWQELDKCRPSKMVYTANLKSLKEELMKDRGYHFLDGLDNVFDSIQSDYIRSKSLPSVEECQNSTHKEAQR